MNAGYPDDVIEMPGRDQLSVTDDVIELPSRSRPGVKHVVTVNVLTNQPSACSCEAWANGRRCWAMQAVATEECSYGLSRCLRCGAICRLTHARTGSGELVPQLVCSRNDDHSGREPAVARLLELVAA